MILIVCIMTVCVCADHMSGSENEDTYQQIGLCGLYHVKPVFDNTGYSHNDTCRKPLRVKDLWRKYISHFAA